MIDIHCHILPALDDGPVNVHDSLEMARQAEADGITTVCATPHIRHDHDVRIDELRERVAELNAALERAGRRVQVVCGGEVAEAAVPGLDDAELREVSLGHGGRWILLEPAPGPLGDSLVGTVHALAGRGFRTVVAHPERHPSPDFEARLLELVEGGALIQFTAALLEDADTAPWVLGLAERGLVHLLGSDAHSAICGRSPTLRAAYERLATVDCLAGHIAWMTREAPEAILSGYPVALPFQPNPALTA